MNGIHQASASLSRRINRSLSEAEWYGGLIQSLAVT